MKPSPLWPMVVVNLLKGWGALMRLIVVATAVCITLVGLAAADNATAAIRKTTSIPAEGLGPALATLAKEFDFQVLYRTEVVGTHRTEGFSGELTAAEALEHALAGTGLTYRYLDDKTITILPVGTSLPQGDRTSPTAPDDNVDGVSAPAKEGRKSSVRDLRLAQVDQGSSAGSSATAMSPVQSVQSPAALQEVVVTAQKRTEREQDVPTTIVVLSGAELEDRGAVQLEDYAKEVPGMNVIGARGPGLGEIVLRGITTGSDHSSPVGLYLDDVPFTPSSPIALTTNLAFDPDLADIDHIEVLEGPQSTLYGANTVGGLVKFVTKQPDLHTLEGELSVTGTDIDAGGTGGGARASINLPIVDDVVGLRVSAFYRNDAGFVDNEYSGAKNVNWDSVRGGRFSLRVKFSDQLETTLTGMAQDIDQPGPNQVYLNPATLQPTFGRLAYSSAVAQPSDSTYRSLSDTTTFRMPFAQLTNVASYAKFENDSTVDFSSLSGSAGLPPGDLLNFANTSSSKRYTDELRLASTPGRIEWLLGGFYTRESDDNLEIDTGLNPDGSVTPVTSPYHNVYDGNFVPHFREGAVFGDLTFHITDQVAVAGGARYSANNQSVYWTSTGAFGINNVPSYNLHDSATTYLGTVTYTPNRDLTLYVRAASAYRPGGPNVLNDLEISGGALPAYKSDLLWNYEAGIKGSAWDHRINYTADGYHMVWSNIQLTETLNNFIVVANGSGAKSDGAEASLAIEPIEHLLINLKGAYTDARFTAAAPALGAVSGDPLPYAPKTMLAAIADYSFGKVADWTPTLGLTYAYHGADESAYSDGVTYHIPSYETLDLRAGAAWNNYSVIVRAINVANEYGLTSVMTSSALHSPVEGTVIQPRTFELTLKARF
jgi:iron complex outermembrane recepter protein